MGKKHIMKITKEQLKQFIKEELYVIQNGTDHESNFHDKMEGTLHYLPGAQRDADPHSNSDAEKNAEIANDIENFIGEKMQSIYGNPMQWSDEQNEVFDKINDLLNIIFPSGD